MIHLTRTLELLDKLVAFPTVSHDSNLDLIDWVENLLSGAGFEVTRICSPDRTKAGLFAVLAPRSMAVYAFRRTPMLCQSKVKFGPARHLP